MPTEKFVPIKTPATVRTMSTVCTSCHPNALVGVKPNFDDWSARRKISGVPASMEMKVVLVSAGHGTGLESTANPDKLVVYNGE